VSTSHDVGSMELVGRERELKRFGEFLDNTKEGAGSTVLLSGEAGIGKTRLVSEFISLSESRGVRVFSGSALADSLDPFRIFSDALEGQLDKPLFSERESVTFTEIFVINRAGLLMAQASSGEGGLDADIFSGMLSAVQDFVRDSFDSSGAQKAGLGRLEYGDRKIIIEHGNDWFLTAVFRGVEHPDMKDQLKRTIRIIDDKYGKMIKSWSGQMEDIQPVQDEVTALAGVRFLVRRDLEGVELENERVRIADRVLEIVIKRSARQPLLIILEDLHWADGPSLFVLNYLARNIRNENVLILGTLRPDEGMFLKATMNNMRSEDLLHEVVLEKLQMADIVSLTGNMFEPNNFSREFVDRLSTETEGNPFFIVELLNQMQLDGNIVRENGTYVLANEDYTIPDSVEGVVHRRLEGLDPDTMVLAEYASCIGRVFERDVALSFEALRGAPAALEKLLDSGLILAENGSAEFVHAIFQDVIYQSIGDRWKRVYHKNLGEYYENNFENRLDEVYYELARHFFRSRESDKALNYCIHAGEKAENAYAAEQAIEFYKDSLTLITGGDKEIEMSIRLGDLYALTGSFDSAIETFQTTIEKEMSNAMKANILWKIAEIHHKRSDFKKSQEVCARGLELLEGTDSIETSRLLSVLGWIGIRTGEYLEAVKKLEDALTIAQICQDKKEIANIEHNIGSAYLHKGDYANATGHLEKALEIREDIDDERKLASSLNNMGNLTFGLGKLIEGKEYYERSLAVSKKIGDMRSHALSLNNIGNIHADLGEGKKAVECYEKSFEIKTRFGDKWGISTVLENIGTVNFTKNEFDKALDYYDRSLDIRKEIGDRAGIALSFDNIGEVYHAKGSFEKAVEYYNKGLEICREIDENWLLPVLNYRLADSLLSLGRVGEALTTANKALDYATEINSKSCIGKSHKVLGQIYREQGDLTRSLEELEIAGKTIAETKEKGEMATVLFERAMTLKAIGELEKARQLLEDALSEFKEMGMVFWENKARDKMAKE